MAIFVVFICTFSVCLSVCRFLVFLLYFISRIYVLHCICIVFAIYE